MGSLKDSPTYAKFAKCITNSILFSENTLLMEEKSSRSPFIKVAEGFGINHVYRGKNEV